MKALPRRLRFLPAPFRTMTAAHWWGTTTFGKGSVQNWIPLMNNQGAVRVTIARWLTPNERHIHVVGVEPDVVVEITEEDIEAENDSQLNKAIEILTEGE